MKYMINFIKNFDEEFYSVTTTVDENSFVNFPAEAGNPNYDQFLVDAKPLNKVSGQPFRIAEIEAAIVGMLNQ